MKLLFLFLLLSFNCAKEFSDDKLFDLSILRKLLVTRVVTSSTASTPTTITANTNKYIFLTVSTHNGNFNNDSSLATNGAVNGNTNGIEEADQFCLNEKNTNFSSLPGEANTYKAFLVDGTNRVACTTANCSGGISESNGRWILSANTPYYRFDNGANTLLFTTGSSGIFSFPITNSFDTSTTNIWTGLLNDFTLDFTCTVAWGSTGGTATRGSTGSITNTAISNATSSCSTSLKILCVRQ
jgi:hypothetical protein